MLRKTSLWIFAAGLVGFGLGVYVSAGFRAGRTVAASEVTTADGDVLALRGEVHRLRAEAGRLQRVSEAAANDKPDVVARSQPPLAAWHVLADLQSRKLATPAITFLTSSGKLTDAFASLFALNEQERATLQRVADQACDELARLQRRNATVTRGDDGSVTIAIKSFAAEGGEVYDQLMKGFAQTLGADRNAAFVSLGGEHIEKTLGRFGAPDYTYTFKIKPDRSPEGRTFMVSESYKLPRENSTTNSGYRTWAEMENRVGPVLRLLPPGFGSPQ